MRSARTAVLVTALNLVLLLAAVLGFTTAQAPTPVLRGRSLELVDDRGQIRARLGAPFG